MLKNWVIVYIGNLIGGILVGAGVAFSHQPSLFGNGMAVSVLSTAVSKCSMPFSDAFIKGILCKLSGMHRCMDFLCGKRSSQQDRGAVFPDYDVCALWI